MCWYLIVNNYFNKCTHDPAFLEKIERLMDEIEKSVLISIRDELLCAKIYLQLNVNQDGT